MKNIHEMTLDTVKKTITPILSITQNDINSVTLKLNITQNGLVYDVTTLVPILVCLKPSKKYTINVMDIVDNKLEFTLTQQEVVEAGRIEFVVLMNGYDGTRVSTTRFEMNVINELVTIEEIESQLSVEPLLSKLLSKIENLRIGIESVTPINIGTTGQSLIINNDGEIVWDDVKFDDTEIVSELISITNTLNNKRDKDIVIEETDLSETIKEKLAIVNRDGVDGLSAYQSWLSLGNLGTESDFINSLKGKRGLDGEKGDAFLYTDLSSEQKLEITGVDGLSAYQVAIENGFIGTELEWLQSLKGADGDNSTGISYDDTVLTDRISSVETLLSNKRNSTVKITETDLDSELVIKVNKVPIDGTNGIDGKSAYQIAVKNGFVGTELEWLQSLKGDSGTGEPVENVPSVTNITTSYEGPRPQNLGNIGDVWLRIIN